VNRLTITLAGIPCGVLSSHASEGVWIDNIKAGAPGLEQFTEDFELGIGSWTKGPGTGWFRYTN